MKKFLLIGGASLVLASSLHAAPIDCPDAKKVGKQIKKALSNDLAVQIAVGSGLLRNVAVEKTSFPIVEDDQQVSLRKTDYKCEYLVNTHVFFVIKRE
jgi:hypothetical protein